MLKELKYKQLRNLGCTIWTPRTDRHPQFANSAHADIVPLQVRSQASCMVILYAPNKPYNLSPAAQKILTGMLGVLELATTDIMTSVVYSHDVAALELHIAQWQPKFILQLDMNLPSLGLKNFMQTYSPSFLEQNPQYKAQAYKTLLTLRALLHGTPNRNP